MDNLKKLKRFHILLIIGTVLLTVIVSVILFKQQLIKTGSNSSSSPPTPSPLPVSYVSKQATIKKILKPQESYLLTLTSGEEIIISVDNKTVVAKGLPEFDKDKRITSFKLTELDKSSLGRVKVGDQITITHVVSENKEEDLTATEFILKK